MDATPDSPDHQSIGGLPLQPEADYAPAFLLIDFRGSLEDVELHTTSWQEKKHDPGCGRFADQGLDQTGTFKDIALHHATPHLLVFRSA